MNFHKMQFSHCPYSFFLSLFILPVPIPSPCPYSFSLSLSFALQPSLKLASPFDFGPHFKPVGHEMVPDQRRAYIVFLSSLVKHFNACSDFQILFATSPSFSPSESLSSIITSCCFRRTVFSHSITRPFHVFLPVAISSGVTRSDIDGKNIQGVWSGSAVNQFLNLKDGHMKIHRNIDDCLQICTPLYDRKVGF